MSIEKPMPSPESGGCCRVRVLLGTWVAIEAEAPSRRTALSAIDFAFGAMSDVERLMHPQRPGSDLVRIGESPLHTRVEVNASTWRVLLRAKTFHEWSHGVFDPCLPSRPGRMSDVEIGPDPWVLCRQSVAIDLGGIAKGYAVDCAVETLIASGCTSGIVNAGGDLRVFGSKPRQVLLRRPDGTYIRLELADSALAASDPQAQDQPAEHQGYYLRERASAELGSGSSRSIRRPFAAIIASDAMTADALTKCALLCSEDQLTELLQHTGARCLSDSKS